MDNTNIESNNTNMESKYKNNETKTANNTDSINIAENNKKACNALTAACSEFSKKYNKSEVVLKLTCYVVGDIMNKHGIYVPSFNSTTNNSFLPFIDIMKDYAKKNPNIKCEGTSINELGFVDFCDFYKEKLTQYGCK